MLSSGLCSCTTADAPKHLFWSTVWDYAPQVFLGGEISAWNHATQNGHHALMWKSGMSRFFWHTYRVCCKYNNVNGSKRIENEMYRLHIYLYSLFCVYMYMFWFCFPFKVLHASPHNMKLLLQPWSWMLWGMGKLQKCKEMGYTRSHWVLLCHLFIQLME